MSAIGARGHFGCSGDPPLSLPLGDGPGVGLSDYVIPVYPTGTMRGYMGGLAA